MIQSLIILFSIIQAFFLPSPLLQKIQMSGTAQGTTYHITYYTHSNSIDKYQIDGLLDSIDSSLSLYKPYSLINQFNRQQRGVIMDEHMRNVVQKALEIAVSSNGRFDITCKPIIELWNDASTYNQRPTNEQIKRTMKTVGYQHISIKGDSLIKDNPAVKIDCDGIAQGYTVDQMASMFIKFNINDFIIELGGEVYASGNPPGKPYWEVAVNASSEKMMEDDDQIILLSNTAATTSGSFNKFRKLGRKLYSHVYDPLSGKPIDNNIISVTVISKNAMTSDALDNAIMVMGVKKSFQWLANYNDVGVSIRFRDGRNNILEKSNEYFKKHQLN